MTLNDDKPRLLTIKQAAAYLGFSVSLLNKWRSTGTGPRFIKIGQRIVRYHSDDLVAFIASRRRKRISDI